MPYFHKQSKAQAVVPYELCPAKTWTTPGVAGRDVVLVGRSVLEHCSIVAHVAQSLLARMPPSVQALYPKDAAFAAGCHDIGKVSPWFYEKIRRAMTPGMNALSPLLEISDPDGERQWGGHAGVSQVASAALGAKGLVPAILGQHHGTSPAVDIYRSDDEIFGGEQWQQERAKLVAALKQQCDMDWPTVSGPAQARLVAGLTTVADWIGSGRFFEDPSSDWRAHIEQAIDDAGFVAPTYRHGLSFEQVFGFEPRPAQVQLIESVQGPGVYVLEAPMGMGKTEAALYAAYRMLEKGVASGVYFALPTQLTSNKIHERFEGFLSNVLDEDCRHRSWLLHGSSWLTQTQMGEDARPGGAWFSQSKRGLLAPFAVGTIDQALMAAMRVKHGFVRAFGLAGKVVILDEVHSYDVYTGAIMDALVALLRELGCTVIILSATLHAERIREMLGQPELPPAPQYPLITAHPTQGSPLAQHPVPPGDIQHVEVQVGVEQDAALQEALSRAHSGEFVLWIENTVKQAQERFRQFQAALSATPLPVGLLHSRFLPTDRQKIEDEWVTRFGKDGWSTRHLSGCILVGTQVLEQSLDLDADFLVSAFAPTDMLLQRMGRLWRHANTPRVSSARRQSWIISPSEQAAIENPIQAFGPSAFVYSPYVLCRSLEAWAGRTRVCLPGDVRPLIEATYAARAEQGTMERWFSELEHGTKHQAGRQRLRGLAALALSDYGRTEPEDRAQTRHSQSETAASLLLRSVHSEEDMRQTRLTLLTGEVIILPWSRSRLDKPAWRQIAVALSRQVINLPAHEAPAPTPVKQLSSLGLGHVFYLGDAEADHVQLRVGVVNPDTSVARLWGLPVFDAPGRRAQYLPSVGYQVFKDRE